MSLYTRRSSRLTPSSGIGSRSLALAVDLVTWVSDMTQLNVTSVEFLPSIAVQYAVAMGLRVLAIGTYSPPFLLLEDSDISII